MQKLTLFYLEDCPYCHNARRAYRELVDGDARYGKVEVDWVEESEHPEISEQYDYYYVPTIFAGRTKLYEAHPGERYEECLEQIQKALDAALAG